MSIVEILAGSAAQMRCDEWTPRMSAVIEVVPAYGKTSARNKGSEKSLITKHNYHIPIIYSIIVLTLPANNITMSSIQYNRIKAVLAERQKTSRWLAEQLGKSTITVSRWCTNAIQPTIEQLFTIADILAIDVKELIISNRYQQG